MPSLYLPMCINKDNSIFAIAQIIRNPESRSFSEIDEESANFFATKFCQMSHLIVLNNFTFYDCILNHSDPVTFIY